jgi:hypothetical protein
MGTKFQTLKFSSAMIAPAVNLIETHKYEPDCIYWLNIEPDVDKDRIHTGSVFWKAFSSRGPMIPQFTWTAATNRKGAYQPSEVGLTHPSGVSVLDRIIDFKITIPKQWQLLQDHPKRGIVFQLPELYSPDEVILFAISVIPVVCPFETDGSFSLVYPDLDR